MRRWAQIKVSVTTHCPASQGLQKGDFLQVRFLSSGHGAFPRIYACPAHDRILETDAGVLNRQKHRLSWDVAAAKDGKQQ